MEAPQERRRDDSLRSAITQLTDNLRDVGDRSLLYSRTLASLCELTDSPVGFVLEHANDGGNLKVSTLLSDGETCSPSANSPINDLEWLRPHLHSRHIRVLHAAELNRNSLTVVGLPTLTRIATIPIADASNVYALICIANASKHYDTSTMRRYWPLVSSATAILRLVIQKDAITEPNIRVMQAHSAWQGTLKQIEAHCLIGLICVDRNHKVLRLNEYAEAIFDLRSNEARAQPLQHLIPERFPNEHKTQLLNPHFIGRERQEQRINGRDAKGNIKALDVSVVPMQHTPTEEFLVFVRDCSEVSALRDEFNENHQRLRAVSDLAPIGIMQANLQWEAQYVNNHWCALFGLDTEDILGNAWLGQLFGENVAKHLTDMHTAIIDGNQFKQELTFFNHNNEQIWADFLAHPIFNANGEVNGFVATLTDQSFRHQAEIKLRKMAEHDTLTGLANRALFADRLKHALKRVDRHGAVALLCLDLDGFKNINDTLGHSSGDKLLVEISKRLCAAVRSEDTVARLGGDEFLILIEDLRDASLASHVAEKILESLKTPTLIGHQEIFVSTSIGIAFTTPHTRNDADTLIKQADMALYRAKNAGRNNYQYYSPELELESRERLELGNSLYSALEKAEFEVHYQLQADVNTNEIVGMEALLRWRHPHKGLIGPDSFIPILEETGIIVPTTRWLLHTALTDLKYLRQESLLSKHCHVAINLSPRLLRDNYLTKAIHCALKDHGLNSQDLVIEITESSLLENSEQIHQVLNTLKSDGIKISLDDFGTGYSSLTYLKNFPIDHLKIDKSFVMDLENNEGDRSITKAVLALAQSLNIKTTAEGVESEGIIRFLKEWGCHHYQGYLLNKPISVKKMAKLLRRHAEAQDTHK